jgi:hypothetical protein
MKVAKHFFVFGIDVGANILDGSIASTITLLPLGLGYPSKAVT